MSFLIDRLNEFADQLAFISDGEEHTYAELLQAVEVADRELGELGIRPSSIVAMQGDFSLRTIATVLVMLKENHIYVPLSPATAPMASEFCEMAEVEYCLSIGHEGEFLCVRFDREVTHPVLKELKSRIHPGLVLFSSGSTGRCKGAVHDFSLILDKFRMRRPAHRMIAFLLFDHIGGINTLLASLASGSTLVTTSDRSPTQICSLIEKYQVDTLPTTPSFLNLLLLSETHKNYDHSSLRRITYGTEVMPESTLIRLNEEFPNVGFHQTYGLTEVGILRTQSENSRSLWMKMGGEGYDTRVRNGMLEIKAVSAMLGYLNAPSPFTEDGWFQTHDAVDVKGEFFQVKGRKTDIINVGGEKVYPAEVESVLQEMPEVETVVVLGEPNVIVGNMVKALVKLKGDMPLSEFRPLMQKYCRERLPNFKIPQKVEILKGPDVSDRFKKIRREQTL